MPRFGNGMQDLDKRAMGKRIRQIRLAAGLRQWELARLLGTTQSAVHKYEHGVVPEPRRLVELARIGDTSIEWVLTGHHWENGSESQQRLSPDLLNTAHILHDISAQDRATVDEALRIVRDAVQALRESDEGRAGQPIENLEAPLRDHSAETVRLLESARRIQRAVLKRVAKETEERLQRSPAVSGNGGQARADDGSVSTPR